MGLPERREFDVTPDYLREVSDRTITTVLWLVDEGDVWRIICMDCGARLGTVNAGNVEGACRLRNRHDQALHS